MSLILLVLLSDGSSELKSLWITVTYMQGICENMMVSRLGSITVMDQWLP
jgi:hypothetical protein